ncbi:MAG: hypothetical protein HRU38_02795 [Saccharospirillaceae bacterium]|nr:hypothetical protein [Pseudomonadales bacterium]NRB77590.1 hypothetical protein [Saccharospirillaceae bacterium]
MNKNYEIGKIVEIQVDGSFSYAVVISEPLVAFSKTFFDTPQTDFNEIFSDDTFYIWIMKYALGRNGWKKVGFLNNHSILASKPEFFKFDLIAKVFSIYDGVNEKRATFEECANLECAAVWDPHHVEDRLLALRDGKTCKWDKSLSASKYNKSN